MNQVTIIGIGDDGVRGLPQYALDLIGKTTVLAGGERHLAMFPDFVGKHITFTGGFMAAVDEITESFKSESVVVLASGDPMFHGAGALISNRCGYENVTIIPYVSSLQLAFATLNKKWDDAAFISLHGKPIIGFVSRLKRLDKVGILTDSVNTPAVIARHMIDYNESGWKAWICENLGGDKQSITEYGTLIDLSHSGEVSDLNVLVLERIDSDWKSAPALMNLHEDDFAKRMPRRGLITKKEIRLLTLGEMRICKDDVVWDIGTASGSVAIGAAAAAYEGRVYALEVEAESLQYCRENVKTFGVDNVIVMEGKAPESLYDIPENPDAVFVGGSKGGLKEIIAIAYDRLNPGGRLVVNAVAFETVQQAYEGFKAIGVTPSIVQMNISRGKPVGSYTIYESQNPIHTFSVIKENA